MHLVLAAVFFVGMAMTTEGQETQLQHYVGEPLLPLLEIFDSAKVSGSLAFSGRCDEGYVPGLPTFRPPSGAAASLEERLSTALPEHPTLQVTEHGKDIVRIVEPGISDDVLDVRISHVSFRGVAYDPNVALRDVLEASEVVAFMKAHDVELPSRMSGGGVQGNPLGVWPPEKPHISGHLDNVTLGEALDFLLKTFPGVWVYETCPVIGDKKRQVYFGFFHLDHWGSKPIVSQ
jgi:hypothetical protein